MFENSFMMPDNHALRSVYEKWHTLEIVEEADWRLSQLGIKSYGLRCDQQYLYAPIYNRHTLYNIQCISPENTHYLFPNYPTKNCYMEIGFIRENKAYVTRDYHSAALIRELYGQNVYVSYEYDNYGYLVNHIRYRSPDAYVVILADDYNHPSCSLTKPQIIDIARSHQVSFTFPDFTGLKRSNSDFSFYHLYQRIRESEHA